MSEVVIKVENISKQYRLGSVGTGSLVHDINRSWHKIRGKEDPYLKIGETNDRSKKGTSEYVWALQNINFQVKQGEVLGIIGKNGAGKSTLLKILSRTTTPTSGTIKVKGRIASLLEVGTGFHPELSGRENIYLNGAILGMTRQEIKSKFDEIIDFAGVERYIDTPVKRYSSGMYVRLAFGVAAHLDPEILIVDEVLAVGDTEFQKKALGKMKEVSNQEGRTVLFVSHNMNAIKNICDIGLLIENGLAQPISSINHIIEQYFLEKTKKEDDRKYKTPSNQVAIFTDWIVINGADAHSCYSREDCEMAFVIKVNEGIKNVEFGLVLRSSDGEIVYGCNNRDMGGEFLKLSPGEYQLVFKVRLPLKYGLYELDIVLVSEGKIIDQYIPINKLNIISKFDTVLNDKWTGVLNEPLTFFYEKID